MRQAKVLYSRSGASRAEARDQKLRRKCGHETLGKMDLVDLMDQMDMPQ